MATPQIIMVLVVSTVFLTTLAWSAPYSVSDPTATPTLVATVFSTPGGAPTATPLPPEYLNNAHESIGITFAAAMLVLIVVVGVIMFLPKNDADHH